jgi:hypothetical protein
MSIKLKYFTVSEAEMLIPTITEMIAAAQETKVRIENKVDDWRKVHKKITEAEEAVLRGQVDFLASHLETQLGKISELGAVPKDLDLGLVDFPARINHKEGYLCWKLGENKIEFWHNLTDGFAGRKPITKDTKIN